ncbi:hypothetical protein M0805_004428 [Coniferiporia weirii]|nr:hypothetical protein M0805_004428 [Coniferiporia weirii]
MAFAIVSQTLRELLSYYPVLLPTLFVFSRESAYSIKIWQAVQRIPHPAPADKNDGGDPIAQRSVDVPSQTLKLKLIGVLSILLFVTVLVPGWLLKSETGVKIFYFCTLFIPLFMSVISAGGTQDDATVIYRNAEGKPAKMHPDSKDKPVRPMIICFFLGIPVTVAALWFGHPLAVFLVYATLLYNLTHCTISTDKLKFKTAFYYALFSVAFLVTLVGIAVTKIANAQKRGLVISRPKFPFAPKVNGPVDWSTMLICALWSVLQCYILSGAYRFDYANSLPPDFRPLVSRKKNIGFRIPPPRYFAVRETFSRPYFSTALASLVLSYVATAALSAAGFIDVTYETSVIPSTFFAMITMVFSMLALSAVKGQFGKLWRYEEDWAANPTPREELDTEEFSTSLQKDNEGTSGENLTILDFIDEGEVQGELKV